MFPIIIHLYYEFNMIYANWRKNDIKYQLTVIFSNLNKMEKSEGKNLNKRAGR